MKQVCLALSLLAAASFAMAQRVPREVSAPASTPHPIKMYTPTDSDVYCAGYISDKSPEKGLFVITGQEGGLKDTYTERDVLYLSRGAGFIVNPGGEYMLVRKIHDTQKVDIFDGQTNLIKSLGSVWAEVGRIKIDRISEFVATATVQHACMELQAGDIAVPLNKKATPAAPIEGGFDLYAPATNKGDGVLLTGKEFDSVLGPGNIAYLSVGLPQGAEVGQTYRIYRTYLSASDDPNRRLLDQTPKTSFGMRQSYKLTREQRAVMPRNVIGEGVVISVTGKSSTVLITMTVGEVFPGDLVELKQ